MGGNGDAIVQTVNLVESLAEPEKKTRRLGFMVGQMKVPDDFDTMGQEEIELLFYGEE